MQSIKKHLLAVLAIATASAVLTAAEIAQSPLSLTGQPISSPEFGTPQGPPVDSLLPAVRIAATDPFALEGASTGAFTLVRTGPFTNDLLVNLDISGSASNGVSYVTLSNAITIPAGQRAVDLVVQPLPGAPVGHDQTVILAIHKSDSYVVHGGKAKVTLLQNSLHDLPPVVSITAPSNGALISGTTVPLAAEVTDPGATVDEVRFVHGDTVIGSVKQPPYDLTWSNVTSGAYVLRAWALAGGQWSVSDPVSITVSNLVPTIAITSPADGLTEIGPASVTVTAAVSDPGNAVTKVSFLSNDQVVGAVSTAPYTLTLSNLAVGSYELVARAVTGVGHIDSAPVTIHLTNDRPVVTITSPAPDSTYAVGAPIPLSATATDGMNNISYVAFYAEGSILATVSNAPYAFTWTNAYPGHYALRAKAVSSAGVPAWSPSVGVNVKDQAPVVTITAPVDGASVKVGASVEIDATATDADGVVTEVEFFVGDRSIGTAKAAPYSVTWSPKRAGRYAITAVATDKYGAAGRAKPVTVTVTQ